MKPYNEKNYNVKKTPVCWRKQKKNNYSVLTDFPQFVLFRLVVNQPDTVLKIAPVRRIP